MNSVNLVDEVEPLHVARDARKLCRILDTAAGVIVVDRLGQILEPMTRIELAHELAHRSLIAVNEVHVLRHDRRHRAGRGDR